MVVKNGAYAQALLLTLTAAAAAPDWDLTGANGVYIALLATGCDEAKFESVTAADILYGASGTTNGITEVSTGGGYTAGGIALPTPALSVVTGDIVKYTMANAVWTSSGAGFTLSPGGCYVYSNNATAGNKYAILQLIFTGGPYPASGGGTMTIAANASGLITLTMK